MLWIKAFHLIFVICWFAGLFYLPRLMVYHTAEPLQDRFCIMERRLYYGIMWPAGVLTTLFGLWLMSASFQAYLSINWMRTKIILVLFLWAYHFCCGHYIKQFKAHKNQKNALFYRIFNEVPTILLISIVILAVVKP